MNSQKNSLTLTVDFINTMKSNHPKSKSLYNKNYHDKAPQTKQTYAANDTGNDTDDDLAEIYWHVNHPHILPCSKDFAYSKPYSQGTVPDIFNNALIRPPSCYQSASDNESTTTDSSRGFIQRLTAFIEARTPSHNSMKKSKHKKTNFENKRKKTAENGKKLSKTSEFGVKKISKHKINRYKKLQGFKITSKQIIPETQSSHDILGRTRRSTKLIATSLIEKELSSDYEPEEEEDKEREIDRWCTRKKVRSGICVQCNTTSTSQWRTYHKMEGNICNSCGMFVKKLEINFGVEKAWKIMQKKKKNNTAHIRSMESLE